MNQFSSPNVAILPIAPIQFVQAVHQTIRGQGWCDSVLGGGLVAESCGAGLSCHADSKMSESSPKRGRSLETMYSTTAVSGRARRKYKRRVIRLLRKTTKVTASHESSESVIPDGRWYVLHVNDTGLAAIVLKTMEYRDDDEHGKGG